MLKIDPTTGAGEVVIGSTVLPCNFATNVGPLSFWGYEIESSTDQTATPQYSFDLQTWFDNPPGLLDTRTANSQGELLGSWILSKDGLLPRSHERLFLRSLVEE